MALFACFLELFLNSDTPVAKNPLLSFLQLLIIIAHYSSGCYFRPDFQQSEGIIIIGSLRNKLHSSVCVSSKTELL